MANVYWPGWWWLKPQLRQSWQMVQIVTSICITLSSCYPICIHFRPRGEVVLCPLSPKRRVKVSARVSHPSCLKALCKCWLPVTDSVIIWLFFNLFPSLLLQIKWPSDFIDVVLGLELLLNKSTRVEVRESSPVEPLSLCTWAAFIGVVASWPSISEGNMEETLSLKQSTTSNPHAFE